MQKRNRNWRNRKQRKENKGGNTPEPIRGVVSLFREDPSICLRDFDLVVKFSVSPSIFF